MSIGEFANSTYTIKTTFYENKNGKSDPYAVQEFTTDLKEDKNAFKQSVLEKNQNAQTKSEAEKTRDDDR